MSDAGSHTRALLCAAAAIAAAAPLGARAYSDPSQFAVAAIEAGGGGRFYTGSPADGYGCDSCHAGGSAPEIAVSGLPERYVPRATYELRVSWPAAIEHAAALLELTDERGRGAGSLALPAQDAYVDEELCAPREQAVLGGQLHAAKDGRTIAAVPDCGATQLRVQWTAPDADVGPVWLAGAVLASDHDGNFLGDGVARFAQAVPVFGNALPDDVALGSCAIAGLKAARRAYGAPALAGLLLALALARRVRRSRAAGRPGTR